MDSQRSGFRQAVCRCCPVRSSAQAGWELSAHSAQIGNWGLVNSKGVVPEWPPFSPLHLNNLTQIILEGNKDSYIWEWLWVEGQCNSVLSQYWHSLRVVTERASWQALSYEYLDFENFPFNLIKSRAFYIDKFLVRPDQLNSSIDLNPFTINKSTIFFKLFNIFSPLDSCTSIWDSTSTLDWSIST